MPLYSWNPKTERLEQARKATALQRRTWRYRVIKHDVKHYGVRVALRWFRERKGTS